MIIVRTIKRIWSVKTKLLWIFVGFFMWKYLMTIWKYGIKVLLMMKNTYKHVEYIGKSFKIWIDFWLVFFMARCYYLYWFDSIVFNFFCCCCCIPAILLLFLKLSRNHYEILYHEKNNYEAFKYNDGKKKYRKS